LKLIVAFINKSLLRKFSLDLLEGWAIIFVALVFDKALGALT